MRDTLEVREYVNADTIARGVSAFDPEGAAIEAGRIMLRRLDQLAAERATFSFETTLFGRAYAPWIRRLRGQVYEVHSYSVWLREPDIAIERVRERVRRGGHSIPEEVIRRRYRLGVRNLIRLYSPLVDTWSVYDNSLPRNPVTVASGTHGEPPVVHRPETWSIILEAAR
ncbi:MAG TPA: Zeta toxin family protein [Dehalococcoidia bacterium]|nr:Zeta toxin family protein [Dehalococcoidia bacterium]